jgi:hypothetical protein
MRQDPLYHEDPFLKVRACDQAVLASAEVEDQAPALFPEIRGRKGLFHGWKMRPIRVSSYCEESLERLPRAGVPAGEARGDRLTQDPHFLMFP